MKKIISLLFVLFCLSIVNAQTLTIYISTTPAACQNKNGGEVYSTTSGGQAPYTYLWSSGATTQNLIGVVAGTYQITVTDASGITGTQVGVVQYINPISVSFSTIIHPSCNGTTLGTLTALAQNGVLPYTYLWSNGKVTPTVSNLVVGQYDVTITDSKGCKANSNIGLVNILDFKLKVTPVKPCEQLGTLEVQNLTGGVPPYSYHWQSNNIDTTTTTPILKAVSGYYNVTVTDSQGCKGGKAEYLPKETIVINKTKTDVSSCGQSDGNIIVVAGLSNPTGGIIPISNVSYLWNTGATSNSLQNLPQGTYIVTATDINNCSVSDSIKIFSKEIQIDILEDGACNSPLVVATAITLGGIAPYTYNWSISLGFAEGNSNFIPPGNYTVTVTDTAGCKNEKEFWLHSASSFWVSQQLSNTDCPILSMTPQWFAGQQGNYIYQWSNGATTSSQPFYVLPSNSYVTVTDLNTGCQQVQPVWYKQKDGNYLDIEVCGKKASITPRCSDLNLTYTWDNGETGSVAYNLSVGKHNVTATDPAYNFTYTDTITINNPTCLTTAFLKGKIKEDTDLNCVTDLTETPQSHQIVEILPGPIYTTTDQKGDYGTLLKSGAYTVSTQGKSPYFLPCQNAVPITIVDTAIVNFPMQVKVACPYMEVDISTNRLRRCAENKYFVTYCNNGTAKAKDASIKIYLDPAITYKSASIPLFSQQGDTLTFNVGDVAIGECKTFTTQLLLDCNTTTGQTHCVTAHVFPDTLCQVAPANWSGAKVIADAACTGQEIVFTLKNIGAQAMNKGKTYSIIEDEVIYRQGNFQLTPNEILEIKLPANGKTYRIQAEQEDGYPITPSKPTAWVEACGKSSQGTFSTGFVTMFGNNDGDPFTSTDCRQSIASYDPNEKEAQPKGYQAEHYIANDEEIEYTLHFQNEGTDTAFNVVLRDTLDKSLNVNTIRTGTSSHQYDWAVSGSGILTFTFKNIHLTAKKQNEALSQGFVKFRIAQRQGLACGVMIKNRAGIYFDSNSVILTNRVFHTVTKPIGATMRNANLCFGQSISIGLKTFVETGIYTVRLSDSEGCDSTVILNLTVANEKKSIQNEQLCVNTAPFGIVESQIILKTLSGCDSTVIIRQERFKKDTLKWSININGATGSFKYQNVTYFIQKDTIIIVENLKTAAPCDYTRLLFKVKPTGADDFLNNINVLVAPNPFTEKTIFYLHNSPYLQHELLLFDQLGRLCRKEIFETSRYELERKELPEGIYLYQLRSEGKVFKHGKVVVW
jgi:uncharacterized repeat protein (TIGR01451 family)